MASCDDRTPGNFYLEGDIEFDTTRPVKGGNGDLFAGSIGTDKKVALKRLRVHGSSDNILQRLWDDTLAEARVWRALDHPHILHFLGALFQKGEIYLVSPFIPNGSLPNYIAANPTADRARFLKETADGLAYLHGQGIVHGDVKGGNILISAAVHALLCDFGLSKLLTNSSTATRGGLGTLRWQSPELMDGGARTFESDIYAFGMTIYETSPDTSVVLAVVFHHERPQWELSPSLADETFMALRGIAEECWRKDQDRRPSISSVLESLRVATNDHLLDVSSEEPVEQFTLCNFSDLKAQLGLDMKTLFRRMTPQTKTATQGLILCCKDLAKRLAAAEGPMAGELLRHLQSLACQIQSLAAAPNDQYSAVETQALLAQAQSAAGPRSAKENLSINQLKPEAQIYRTALSMTATPERWNEHGIQLGREYRISKPRSGSEETIEMQVRINDLSPDVNRIDKGSISLNYRSSCPSNLKINRVIQQLRQHLAARQEKLSPLYRMYAQCDPTSSGFQHTRCRLRWVKVRHLDDVQSIQRKTGRSGSIIMDFVIRENEYLLGVVGEDPTFQQFVNPGSCEILEQVDDFGVVLDLDDQIKIEPTIQRLLPKGYIISHVLLGADYRRSDQPLTWSPESLQAHLEPYDCTLAIIIARQ